MAMDFWEAQRRARKQTLIYVSLFLAITLGLAVAAEVAFRMAAGSQGQTSSFPVIGLLFLGVTLGVAFFQYSLFAAKGGGYVARSLGAHKVEEDTPNPKERQLLNVVEEVAIAASMPMPEVYVLPAQQINAFAAGTTKDNCAITVTEGCLATLSRDEFQGVVAHEMGHIHNQDMLVNLRLAAMVMGFFFLLYAALRMLQFAGLSGNRRSRDNKGGNPIVLAALVLLLAGALAWLFGSILKATVSRQREYLADASAVQFTRNPAGIAGALRKIASESHKDMPKAGMAYSHLYLDSHNSLESLFATHPPLAKRIQVLEGLPDAPRLDS